MQLDRTAIVIRERGMMEILDLALHVIRTYLAPLTMVSLLGIAPFFLANRWLLGWLVLEDPRDYSTAEYNVMITRYVYTMALLVMLQSPLATVLIAPWLGKAVFGERASVRSTLKELRAAWGRVLLCQGLIRGSLTCLIVVAGVMQMDAQFAGELPLLTLLALVVMLIRAVRPFLLEIILLERNPLRTRETGVMTVGKRNSALHGAGSGTLFFVFTGSALIAVCLSVAMFCTILFWQGVMLNSWRLNQAMLLYALPASMWISAVLLTVFRFLCYIDLRIRQEGWAVELRMRAEAAKLQGLAL